eukprot:GFUD01008103.1.p1 GENE.GFUD01008103.1~~GFUD01008103.1.p1  ORF type:complete len:350 (+),score=95.34 GFUD01008103.1:140-1051(+)
MLVPCLVGECVVTRGQNCVFPFRHKNVTYAGCTDAGDPDGKLWCSTEVNGQGDHMTGKGAWGHCQGDCPTARYRLHPDCSALRVSDEDEGFTSGIYLVDQGRNHGGRTVYVNKDKELFIFWLRNDAGWGLGYESGLSSGGSFYSSGPDVRDEPWLGAWAEDKLSVVCAIDLPFVQSVQIIPQDDKSCSAGYSCLSRENCPAIQVWYRELLGRRKDDPAVISLRNSLKNKVCNKKERGFCCKQRDGSVCEFGESCRSISNCSSNREKVTQIASGNLPYSKVSTLYNNLKSSLCDSRNKMFCCNI